MRTYKTGLVNLLLAASVALFSATAVSAQTLNDIRWKTESQVRAALGEPNSMSTPIGTHASYTLWQYDNFTVAFANNRAFHMFSKDSLQTMSLNEKRPS